MAIQIYCTQCRSSCDLEKDECPSCGFKFGRNRKYRVSVSNKGKRQNRVVANLSNGIDLFTVAKLLCHKDVRTSERYAHLSNERLRAAAAKAGELLQPKKPDNNKVISIA